MKRGVFSGQLNDYQLLKKDSGLLFKKLSRVYSHNGSVTYQVS